MNQVAIVNYIKTVHHKNSLPTSLLSLLRTTKIEQKSNYFLLSLTHAALKDIEYGRLDHCTFDYHELEFG